ncbi:MAG: DUF5661 family protein [Candidatus Peribacteraceae bacterium]
MNSKQFTPEEVVAVAAQLGIQWESSPFDLDQFTRGMAVELEHGTCDPETNVTDDNPLLTGKIALAHLREFPDYYTRLDILEKEAEDFWENKKP